MGDQMIDDAVLDAFPGVRIDYDNIAYYRGQLEQRLLVNRCDECSMWHHPPRSVCPGCWSRAVTPTEVSGVGSIELLTILRQGPAQAGVDYTDGHALVAVELDEQRGLRIAGTVIGTPAGQLQIGDRVRAVWRTGVGPTPRPDFEVVR